MGRGEFRNVARSASEDELRCGARFATVSRSWWSAIRRMIGSRVSPIKWNACDALEACSSSSILGMPKPPMACGVYRNCVHVRTGSLRTTLTSFLMAASSFWHQVTPGDNTFKANGRWENRNLLKASSFYHSASGAANSRVQSWSRVARRDFRSDTLTGQPRYL